MIEKHFNLKKLNVIKDDFIDLEKPLSDQLMNLYEDMFQAVNDRNNVLLDIGWYGGMSLDGFFLIILTKDENWEEPIMKLKAKSIEQLRAGIKCSLEYMDYF